MKMCSQDCLAKMKILCLQTVQMLLKDAFNNFSKNLCNQSSIDTIRSNSRDSQFEEPNNPKINSTQSTSCSNNEKMVEQDKPTTSTITEQSLDLANNENLKDNLRPIILCNLMQNLVNAINDQCVKQLSPCIIEKKKRKRKRKRKKSKPLNNLTETSEVGIELPCSTEDICSNRPQLKRKVRTNEKSTNRSQDQIRELTSQSSMPVFKHKRLPQKSFIYNGFKNSKTYSLEHTVDRASSIAKTNEYSNEHIISKSFSSSSSFRTEDSHQHHLKHKQLLKRKRNDTSEHEQRKRITSARKPPTEYTRKDTSSSSGSEHSNSSSHSDESSLTYSSSSDDE